MIIRMTIMINVRKLTTYSSVCGLLDYIDHHPNNQLVIIVPIIITLLTKPACSAVSAPWTLTIADLRSPFLTKWTHSEEYFDASGCCGQIMKVIDTIVILHNIV